MRNNKIYIFLLSVLPLSFLWTGCSEETLQEVENSSAYVQLGTVTQVNPEEVQTKGGPDKFVNVPEGTYYLGYKKSDSNLGIYAFDILANNEIDLPHPENGSLDTYETTLLWANILKESSRAKLTLSNVGVAGDGTPIIPADEDILWGGDTKTGYKSMTRVDFTLKHIMAQVQLTVDINNPEITEVKEVYLEGVKREYVFNRDSGRVEVDMDAVGEKVELKGELVDGVWTGIAILPPQKRNEEMLMVVVTDQGKYTRALPLGMQVWWKTSAALEFEPGHTLKLDASITKDLNYVIHITLATLFAWDHLGTFSTYARTPGLYDPTGLADWAVKYNAFINAGRPTDQKDPVFKALLPYGKYDSVTGKWNFTVYKSFKVSSWETENFIPDFQDILTRHLDTTTIGMQESTLLNRGEGCEIENGIFNQ